MIPDNTCTEAVQADKREVARIMDQVCSHEDYEGFADLRQYIRYNRFKALTRKNFYNLVHEVFQKIKKESKEKNKYSFVYTKYVSFYYYRIQRRCDHCVNSESRKLCELDDSYIKYLSINNGSRKPTFGDHRNRKFQSETNKDPIKRKWNYFIYFGKNFDQ